MDIIPHVINELEEIKKDVSFLENTLTKAKTFVEETVECIRDTLEDPKKSRLTYQEKERLEEELESYEELYQILCGK